MKLLTYSDQNWSMKKMGHYHNNENASNSPYL
jgi:hypothetical protein